MAEVFADEVVEYNSRTFSSEEELTEFFNTEKFVRTCKELYGRNLPALFRFMVNDEPVFAVPNILKQGLPMDWRFFAEIDPITAEDINAEENIEKRRALIIEYGVNNYLKNVEVLSKDAYGVLIEANIDGTDDAEGERQRFVKVRNGTEEPEENKASLREKGMLTDDGHKIYYIPVGDEITTAKMGIEWSWDLPEGSLPAAGWDEES